MGGLGQGSSVGEVGYGRYWSSTLVGPGNAFRLRFSANAVDITGLPKWYGFAVRCVKYSE
ncbi:hypothetical protein [Odoribacter lunatus]|uniref:hypothetical protein n=1 Tax=Odoribacter lunatus TaxID=2941335 RepID=UPI00203F23CD|nr:hypothetical protein [Odoribacter lunatus]